MSKEIELPSRPTFNGSNTELRLVSDNDLLIYISKYAELFPEFECTTSELAMFLKYEYGIVDWHTQKNKGLRDRLNWLQHQPNSKLKREHGKFGALRYYTWSVEI